MNTRLGTALGLALIAGAVLWPLASSWQDRGPGTTVASTVWPGAGGQGRTPTPPATTPPPTTSSPGDGTPNRPGERLEQPTAGTGDDHVGRVAPRPRPGLPESIVVPRLGVQAPVVPITTVNRVLLPPSDPQTIGWWVDGARPGAKHGSAILTGHTVHTGGGAFDDLDRLDVGDRVRVRTSENRLGYVVRSVTNYSKQSLARHAADVFAQDKPGRLVLVTCEDWNGVGYLSNAVVVADPTW